MKVKILVHNTKPNIFGYVDHDTMKVYTSLVPELFDLQTTTEKLLKNYTTLQGKNYKEDFHEEIWELNPIKTN